MRFCVNLAPVGWHKFVQAARLADRSKFSWIGVVDSPSLFFEATVASTVLALNTSHARIGPVVVNPRTRHPTVVASALMAVQGLAKGRVVVAIGTGDTAVANAGLQRTRVNEVEEYVCALRDLWRQGETYIGRSRSILKLSGSPIRVYVAAGGPRMVQVAARVADGIILSCGIEPSIVARTITHLYTCLAAANRDKRSFEVWLVAVTSSESDRAAATAAVRGLLAGFANNSLRGDLAEQGVPAEYWPALRELQLNYSHGEHIGRGGSSNEALVDRLALTPYLTDRYLLNGENGQILEAMLHLENLGVTGLILSAPLGDRSAVIRRFGAFVATSDDARALRP